MSGVQELVGQSLVGTPYCIQVVQLLQSYLTSNHKLRGRDNALLITLKTRTGKQHILSPKLTFSISLTDLVS
jgi:hypothetical protein